MPHHIVDLSDVESIVSSHLTVIEDTAPPVVRDAPQPISKARKVRQTTRRPAVSMPRGTSLILGDQAPVGDSPAINQPFLALRNLK